MQTIIEGVNMRKISEMYKRSGGSSWRHNCEECKHFHKYEKKLRCDLFEADVCWKSNYVACKFFEEPVPEEIEGQLNIFDIL